MLFTALALLTAISCSQYTPVLTLNGEINHQTVAPLVRFFVDGAKRHTPAATLYIDSHGGMNEAGYTLIRAMLTAEEGGMDVTCVAQEADSMAAVLFETACSHRVIKADGHLMFHETRIPVQNPDMLTREQLLAWAAALSEANELVAKLVSGRMHMSPEEYLKWIAGTERWVDASTALTRGWADEVMP